MTLFDEQFEQEAIERIETVKQLAAEEFSVFIEDPK
jgi:hypothetical protein